jgi:hypothetical protein
MQTKKGVVIPMLHQKSLSEQAKTRFSILFSTLQIGQLLRKAGIKKSFGPSSLVQILFSHVFEGRNWFRILESERGVSLPGKDVIYRSLNQGTFAWRKFLHSFALKIILHFESLIAPSRTRVFIIDDSVLKRDRSKKAELLARVFDDTTGRFTKGFTMLTLGWSVGFSFAPIDFVMLSSAKLVKILGAVIVETACGLALSWFSSKTVTSAVNGWQFSEPI